MIGSLLSKMATAGKLSIPQLQKSIQDGTVPSYIGIPMLDEMINQQKQAQAFAGAQQQGQPPIAEQVMQAANQVTQQPAPQMPMQEQAPQGITSAQSNLPTEYAGGGIVAFGEKDSKEQLVKDQFSYFDALREQVKKAREADTPLFVSNKVAAPRGMAPGVAPTLTPAPAVAPAPAPAPVTPAPVTPSLVVNRDKGGPKRSPNGPELMPMYEGIFANPNAPAVAPTPDTAVAPTEKGIEQLSAADERSKQLTGDLADLKGLISGSYNDPEKALTQKALLAMLKGGLRAAAGTSMHGITNIAQGAETGVDELAKGIDQIDADKRAKASQLIALGLKGTELRQELAKMGITENWYAAHYPGLAAQAALHTAQATAYPEKTRQEAALIDAQIREINLGKIPYYRGRAANVGRSGASSVGSVPGKLALERKDMYEAFAANPTSDPKFFSMLSPDAQLSLKKTPPTSDSHKSALVEAKKLANQLYINDMRLVQSLGTKKSSNLYSPDED